MCNQRAVGGGMAEGGAVGEAVGVGGPQSFDNHFFKRLNADKKLEGGRWRYQVRGKRTCRKLSI